MNSELTANIEDASEFEVLMEKYNYEVNLKKDLVNQLNAEIKENEINYEKINLLIERYAQDKEKLNETNSKSKLSKIVLFCSITIALLLVHFVSSFFSNRGKLNKKKYIYINFFIVFAYILFLIWFFFYLYPEFSVFLIFMS
ncbi:MAG: hypothetical protein LBD88_05380 [Candidatus Peribacteria bacterium]|nr:hypothetical protein [Candidatus Peribacteria bacterium]